MTAGLVWRKSSRCEAHNCLWVAELPDGRIGVRDSAGTVLEVDRAAWRQFVAALK